ncbi:MAG TPA: DUF2240 family protein [Patescibacteria group bacterium]|nr:DUF2240 family protein [Patescibacteria group bacterium]
MSGENYERILKKISSSANIDKEEIERRIEAKRAKLSGLISKEGAAQIVAAELGINFDNEKLKINELLPGMRKVNLVGKIINISPVREFTRNGKEGKVVNLLIADETSNIKIVLWDLNHIQLIERKEIGEGSVIEIGNGSMRDNEVHLGSFSEFKPTNVEITDAKTEKIMREDNIANFKISQNMKTRAFIVQIFEPKFFNVCPQCKKKISNEGEDFICLEHGKVAAEKRALINLVIDDGTETIRSVVFHDNIKVLGINLDEDFSKYRESLLGKELFFSGNVRTNKIFNTPEFVIEGVEEVNLDNLMQNLEKAN